MKDKRENHPNIITDVIEMPEANSTVEIYRGEYFIKNEKYNIRVKGRITYDWFPSIGVRFYGNINNDENEIRFLKSNNTYYCNVFIDGLKLGKGIIRRLKIETTPKGTIYTLAGIISGSAIHGDKSICADKIKFGIPNLGNFLGSIVQRVNSSKSTTLLTNRLEFNDDKCKIIIDKCYDYEKRLENLKEKGGFVILYNGELTYKKGTISYSSLQDIIYCFNTFLSFINGRRTAAIFLEGIANDIVKWTEYSTYKIDPYKTVSSWTKTVPREGLNVLWMRFRKIWKQSPDDKNFLITSIHWYVEANSNAGFSEGSIILAQTALELIYNWWIVENKKIILGKDSENISASNKIRILLSQLNLSNTIPTAFTALRDLQKADNNLIDSPEAIVYIRNAIVHSQEKKRNKLSTIPTDAIYEAQQVYIWYIELSLLCILDYNDEYYDRCIRELYEDKCLRLVPWKVTIQNDL